MERWYVNIAHLDEDQLSFFGYVKADENDEFAVYQHHTGESHIVRKSDPFIYVDDLNDAFAMNSTSIVEV